MWIGINARSPEVVEANDLYFPLPIPLYLIPSPPHYCAEITTLSTSFHQTAILFLTTSRTYRNGASGDLVSGLMRGFSSHSWPLHPTAAGHPPEGQVEWKDENMEKYRNRIVKAGVVDICNLMENIMRKKACCWVRSLCSWEVGLQGLISQGSYPVRKSLPTPSSSWDPRYILDCALIRGVGSGRFMPCTTSIINWI